MKNKKLLFFLIPLVLLIWGTIFYKIFSSPNSEEDISDDTVPIVQKSSLVSTDTFSIIADYRDPFLGHFPTVLNISTDNKQPKPVIQPKPETVVQWPSITYGGMIKNQQSATLLALVKINGKDNILKTGESANGIILEKIFKDSIELKMGKDRRVIKK